MALVKATLEAQLLALVGNSNGFPSTYTQAATNFAKAVNAYGSLVTPISTTSSLALTAFVSAFVASKPKESIEILVDAVRAYCVALAPGMAGAGFVGTPPPVDTALKAALLSASQIALKGGSANDWAKAAATAIDVYFKTGIAVNVVTGAVVTWL